MRNYQQSNRARSNGPQLRTFLLAFIITAAVTFGVFLCYKTFIKKDIVIIPKKMTYDDSLTASEKEFLDAAFADARLSRDVEITATTESVYPTGDDDYVFSALVPVTGFNNPLIDINASKLASLTELKDTEDIRNTVNSLATDPDDDEIYLIPAENLTSNFRLLSVDEQYYLDDFKSGAMFRVFHLKSSDTTEAKDLISAKKGNSTSFSSENVLSINQTGVTALSRAMILKLNKVGDGAYFAANIKDFLSSSDLTHISNEVSFADDCKGGTNTVVLCSDWRMLDSILAIGTDIIELTGNHNNDWSAADNLATLAKYKELGLKTFGGGKDEETAAIPLQISQKGTNITWIGVNESTSTKANGQGANGSKPGANIYNETLLRQQIKEAKERGDFVIVDIQYFECYAYPDGYVEMPSCDSPNWGYNQRGFFQSIVDINDDATYGPDLIVGTQAHQPQTYELYEGVPIYYGLGNLFFDQTYWPGTERGLILTHYFYNGHLLQTKISPTIYDEAYQVKLMDTSSAESFLTRLGRAR